VTLRATAVMLAVGCIWGTSFLYSRILVQEGLSPAQVVLGRSFIGGAALVVIALLQRHNLGLNRRNLTYGLFAATFGALAPFMLISWGVTHVESGTASILNATVPLFIVVLTVAQPDEVMTKARAAGILTGFVGVIILTGNDLTDLASANAVAVGAILLAMALYAVTNVASRFAIRDWDSQSFSTVQIGLAGAIALPIVGIVDPPSFDYGWKVWGSLLGVGLLGTGLAYLGYYWLVHNVGSVRASLQSYLIPVVGVIAGAIVLGEDVGWNTFAGGLVILAGVALVSMDSLRRLSSRLAPTSIGVEEPASDENRRF